MSFVIVTPSGQSATPKTTRMFNTSMIAEVRDLSTHAELVFADARKAYLAVEETFAEMADLLAAAHMAAAPEG